MRRIIIFILILFLPSKAEIWVENKIMNNITVNIYVEKLYGKLLVKTQVLKINQVLNYDIQGYLRCCRAGLLTLEIENLENTLITHNLYNNWNYSFFILSDGVYVSESINSQNLDDLLNSLPFRIFSFN